MHTSHITMPQMSQVLRERAIGMLTAGMSTRAVARELNVNFKVKVLLFGTYSIIQDIISSEM